MGSSIESLIWRERLRTSLWVLVGLAIVGAILWSAALYATGSTREVGGIVDGHHQSDSQTGGISYLLVKLDSGETVKAGYVRGTPVRKGSRVLLSEKRTNLGGLLRYRFLSYQD
jgi:hypothetical protein